MIRSVCVRVCSSLLVVAVGIPVVLSAPAIDATAASTGADTNVQRHYHTDFVDWISVRDKTICPAQVAYNEKYRVLEVWCADGVEGQILQARGQQYVCRSLRYTIQSVGAQVDVLGGCVARLDEVLAKADDKPKADEKA